MSDTGNLNDLDIQIHGLENAFPFNYGNLWHPEGF